MTRNEFQSFLKKLNFNVTNLVNFNGIKVFNHKYCKDIIIEFDNDNYVTIVDKIELDSIDGFIQTFTEKDFLDKKIFKKILKYNRDDKLSKII